jgi:hypothetical protein
MFDLAVVLHKDIEEIEAMSSRQLSEWMAYSRIKALPDAHWDAAQISSVVANAMGGGKRVYSVEDFYPSTSKPEALSAEDSVKALANAMKAGFKLEDRTR